MVVPKTTGSSSRCGGGGMVRIGQRTLNGIGIPFMNDIVQNVGRHVGIGTCGMEWGKSILLGEPTCFFVSLNLFFGFGHQELKNLQG